MTFGKVGVDGGCLTEHLLDYVRAVFHITISPSLTPRYTVLTPHHPPTPQNPLHRKLLNPPSTRRNHSATIPHTISGFSHNVQCPVATSFRVKFGIQLSIPSDMAGGSASSFVAWMKRTGMLIILRLSDSSSRKFCSRLRYQFTIT